MHEQGDPRVEYDLVGIRQNCVCLAGLCAQYGLEIAGVTKATAGNPDIASAMMASGISHLADARLANIERLRRAGISAPLMLLRPPALGEVDRASALADIFLLSEISTIRAVANACGNKGKTADILIMIDLGDLREGVLPAELPALIDAVIATPNTRIVGVGTNLACNLGVLPDAHNMAELVALAKMVETKLGQPLRYISAGNSSALALMQSGKLPLEINHLRLGESLLFGRETAYGAPIKGTRQDSFALVGQILEQRQKWPLPNTTLGKNAFGQQVAPPKRGKSRLAVLNIGAVDTEISGLTPLKKGVKIVGHSSDHLIVDTSAVPELSVGDELRFLPNYHALATAMSSPYLMQSIAGNSVMPATMKGKAPCLALP